MASPAGVAISPAGAPGPPAATVSGAVASGVVANGAVVARAAPSPAAAVIAAGLGSVAAPVAAVPAIAVSIVAEFSVVVAAGGAAMDAGATISPVGTSVVFGAEVFEAAAMDRSWAGAPAAGSAVVAAEFADAGGLEVPPQPHDSRRRPEPATTRQPEIRNRNVLPSICLPSIGKVPAGTLNLNRKRTHPELSAARDGNAEGDLMIETRVIAGRFQKGSKTGVALSPETDQEVYRLSVAHFPVV